MYVAVMVAILASSIDNTLIYLFMFSRAFMVSTVIILMAGTEEGSLSEYTLEAAFSESFL